jgi:carbamoyltransferase
MIILGLNAFHADSSAALLRDGKLIAAAEEERFRRIDGFGDFSSAAWGSASGSEISIQGGVHFPHSLGIFYQAITQYLGFPHYGDEYKVMGLAPYGRPSFLCAMREMVRCCLAATSS